MTQKSMARLQRDADKKEASEKIKNNTCWDDLDKIYTSTLHLLSKHAHLSQFAVDKELISAVADKVTLTANIKSLARDLKVLGDELHKIHQMHENKVGGTTDPDEFFSTIQISEHYNLFMERHDAVIMPTAYHIIEQFAQAETLVAKRKNELKAAEDLKDPNVISDAEIIYPHDEINPAVTRDTVNIGGLVVDRITRDCTGTIDPSKRTPLPPPDFGALAKSFNEIHPHVPEVPLSSVTGE